MTRSDLIRRISAASGVSLAKTRSVVIAVFDAMSDAMVHGERIEIRGFGSFVVRSYGAYVGRNPRTGERIPVNPKRLPLFRAGRDLHRRLNPELTDTADANAADSVAASSY